MQWYPTLYQMDFFWRIFFLSLGRCWIRIQDQTLHSYELTTIPTKNNKIVNVDIPSEELGDVGEEVEGIPEQGGLHVRDGLHPRDVRVDLSLRLQ